MDKDGNPVPMREKDLERREAAPPDTDLAHELRQSLNAHGFPNFKIMSDGRLRYQFIELMHVFAANMDKKDLATVLDTLSKDLLRGYYAPWQMFTKLDPLSGERSDSEDGEQGPAPQ